MNGCKRGVSYLNTENNENLLNWIKIDKNMETFDDCEKLDLDNNGANQIIIKREIKEEILVEEENICKYQEPISQITIKEELKNLESEHENDFCLDNFVDKNSTTTSKDSEIPKFEEIKTDQSDVQMHKCYVCDKEFDKYGLELHFVTTHSFDENEGTETILDTKSTFDIVQEGEISTDQIESSVHEKVENYTCEMCNNGYNTAQNLKLHVSFAHKGKTVHSIEEKTQNVDKDKIEQSNQSSLQHFQEGIKDLQNHINNVLDGVNIQVASPEIVKIYKCETCGKTFGNANNLKQHIILVHEGVKNHKCEICGKTFSQIGGLKKHIMIVHEGVKNHKCETCGRACVSKKDLSRHISAVHKGERNYKCENCLKTFSQASKLKIHISSVHRFLHEEVKNYKCDICGKAFSQKRTLDLHLCVKNHKCDTCGKVFGSSWILKNHINFVHEGFKNTNNTQKYKCETCGNFYRNSCHLKNHIQSFHEGVRYECDICSKVYASKGALCRHLKSVHELKSGHSLENSIKIIQDPLNINEIN